MQRAVVSITAGLLTMTTRAGNPQLVALAHAALFVKLNAVSTEPVAHHCE